MVATVNPCGFAMLPAYLGYFLGDRNANTSRRIGTVSASVAAGFLAVFTVAGLLVGIGVRVIVGAIPWMALVVGVGLVLFGVSQLLGRRLLPYLPGPKRVRKSGTPFGMFTFGATYAIASLSCTLPIFLSLVTSVVASGSPIEAVTTFVAYGAGMAVVVVGLTVTVAAGRHTLVRRLRPLSAHLERVSGAIMAFAGVFIVWYWSTVLAGGPSALSGNVVIERIDEWSGAVTGFIGDRPLLIAAPVVAATVWVMARGRRATSGAGRITGRDDHLDGLALASQIEGGREVLESHDMADDGAKVDGSRLEEPDRLGEAVLADEGAEDRQLLLGDGELLHDRLGE
jgi:cytochrome c biogenesis protein CcdA